MIFVLGGFAVGQAIVDHDDSAFVQVHQRITDIAVGLRFEVIRYRTFYPDKRQRNRPKSSGKPVEIFLRPCRTEVARRIVRIDRFFEFAPDFREIRFRIVEPDLEVRAVSLFPD